MSPMDKIPTLGLGGDDEVAIAREVVRKDVDIRLGKNEWILMMRGIRRKDDCMCPKGQSTGDPVVTLSSLAPT
jgi:hypothetical protein